MENALKEALNFIKNAELVSHVEVQLKQFTDLCLRTSTTAPNFYITIWDNKLLIQSKHDTIIHTHCLLTHTTGGKHKRPKHESRLEKERDQAANRFTPGTHYGHVAAGSIFRFIQEDLPKPLDITPVGTFNRQNAHSNVGSYAGAEWSLRKMPINTPVIFCQSYNSIQNIDPYEITIYAAPTPETILNFVTKNYTPYTLPPEHPCFVDPQKPLSSTERAIKAVDYYVGNGHFRGLQIHLRALSKNSSPNGKQFIGDAMGGLEEIFRRIEDKDSSPSGPTIQRMLSECFKDVTMKDQNKNSTFACCMKAALKTTAYKSIIANRTQIIKDVLAYANGDSHNFSLVHSQAHQKVADNFLSIIQLSPSTFEECSTKLKDAVIQLTFIKEQMKGHVGPYRKFNVDGIKTSNLHKRKMLDDPSQDSPARDASDGQPMLTKLSKKTPEDYLHAGSSNNLFVVMQNSFQPKDEPNDTGTFSEKSDSKPDPTDVREPAQDWKKYIDLTKESDNLNVLK
ncbi:MAG: hypothetical protein IPP74_09520 [Alphaproteobacteria bacterium]|nr:hypothetical protein [Alphaproteobacteria bacterium]